MPSQYCRRRRYWKLGVFAQANTYCTLYYPVSGIQFINLKEGEIGGETLTAGVYTFGLDIIMNDDVIFSGAGVCLHHSDNGKHVASRGNERDSRERRSGEEPSGRSPDIDVNTTELVLFSCWWNLYLSTDIHQLSQRVMPSRATYYWYYYWYTVDAFLERERRYLQNSPHAGTYKFDGLSIE
jgi:hypothetical protein